MVKKFLMWLVMNILQYLLNDLRKFEDTPCIRIRGEEKDFPKYLIYTDCRNMRHKLRNI